MAETKGKLLIIGFGPGSFEHITERARQAIEESEVIIGYNTYVDLIQGLLTNQTIVRTGMTEEVSRAQEAVRQAEMGKRVAVISSGDSGVYGMAGLVYEVLIEKRWKPATGVEVEVIPGISAINSCASLLGAPVMHDACTISLSDHLTPWETIAKRVEAAASADFIIALYNPRTGRRTRQIVETQRILLKHRSPETPVGLVKSAYRDREQVIMTTLGSMLEHDIGMLTTVIIGNSITFIYEGLIITPRGYQRKYTLIRKCSHLGRMRDCAQSRSRGRLMRRRKTGAIWKRKRMRVGMSRLTVRLCSRWLRHLSGLICQRGSIHLLWRWKLLRLGSGGIISGGGYTGEAQQTKPSREQMSIFEVGVAPGIANKKFSARQMALLAELVGENGEMEYTPHHQIIMRVEADDPANIIARLKAEKLLVFPIGDVAQIKACDFCNLEKDEAIPVAEELNRVIGGLKAPKEFKVGLNGCGMACYGAVLEDVGIVYRRGAFDLFLGGKTTGRTRHAAQPVAEGISAEDIVPVIERVFREYEEQGHPNERFHKFFKRVGIVAGFEHQDHVSAVVVDAVCGD